jgi:AraC-like DNA-binding protein
MEITLKDMDRITIDRVAHHRNLGSAQRSFPKGLPVRAIGYSIKEIATSVGYNDPLYFSRWFRQISGESATDYAEVLKNR